MSTRKVKESEKKSGRGGARKGAGRPALGKAPYNVMLTVVNVTKARNRTENLSAVLDGLLTDWLTS